jgi:hypothetical protein
MRSFVSFFLFSPVNDVYNEAARLPTLTIRGKLAHQRFRCPANRQQPLLKLPQDVADDVEAKPRLLRPRRRLTGPQRSVCASHFESIETLGPPRVYALGAPTGRATNPSRRVTGASLGMAGPQRPRAVASSRHKAGNSSNNLYGSSAKKRQSRRIVNDGNDDFAQARQFVFAKSGT